MSWRAMLRLNHSVDATIAMTVTPTETTLFKSTNVASDCENSSQIVSAAFNVCANAHNNEI